MLSCLDVDLDPVELAECFKKLGLTYQGVYYVRYEPILRQMHFDNHSEKWTIKGMNDDDALSTITERRGGDKRNRMAALRMSFEQNKP